MTVNFGMMNPYMMGNMMDAPLLNPYTSMGMGYGMVGGIPGFNPQQQMQNIQQWDNFGVNRQVAGFKNQNNAQFQMQAQNGSIERQVRILSEQIKENNQDNVKAEYQKLLQAIRATYGSQIQGSEEDKELTLKQYADQIYAQMTGSYMTDDIRANSSSSFVSGIKQILSFGFGNKTTADENIAMISGAKQTRGSKASKVAGNIVGGLLGGVVAVGAFLLGKHVTK